MPAKKTTSRSRAGKPARKSTGRKTASKRKSVPKKSAPKKKVSARKATAKKSTRKATKKTTSRKSTARKATSKKTTRPKAKASAKRATGRKSTARKSTPRRTGKKATSGRKRSTAKAASEKPATSKAPKKATPKKVTSKKASSKKAGSKKAKGGKRAADKGSVAARAKAAQAKKQTVQAEQRSVPKGAKPVVNIAARQPRVKRPWLEAKAKLDEDWSNKPTKSPLTKAQLRPMRKQLIEKRERLLSDMNMMGDEALRAPDADVDAESGAEHGTDVYERNLTLGLMEQEARILRQIEAALQAMESGTYGLCEECGDAIPLPRLDALPFASTCVPCQEQQEGLY